MTALGVGTMTWGLAHQWLHGGPARTDVAVLSGCVAAALALLAGWLFNRFQFAPRWWFGSLVGAACGAACVPSGGDLAPLVYPFFGALVGTLGIMLFRYDARLHLSAGLDRLPRLLAGAGVWLAVVVLVLVVFAPHFLAPWLRLTAFVAVGLAVAGAAVAGWRVRWLQRVASGRDDQYEISLD